MQTFSWFDWYILIRDVQFVGFYTMVAVLYDRYV